jgi:hypothetical protein
MDQNQVFKQMMDFQKAALQSSFNTLEIIQNRSEKVMKMFWDQTSWASDKLNSTLSDWTQTYQDGCQTLTRTVEDNITKMGNFVGKK